MVYLAIAGVGRTGPRAGEPLTDTVAQAFSGYMSINRDRDGIPHKTGTTIIDAVTGLYAFQAVTLALWPGGAREARHLDVSLMGSAAAVLGPKVLEAAFLGRAPETINAPAGSYRTSDGWIAVTLVREKQFQALVRAIGEPDLARDPRFADFAERSRNLAPPQEIIAARLADRTPEGWLTRFTAAGVLARRLTRLPAPPAPPPSRAPRPPPRARRRPAASLPVPRNPGQKAQDRPCPGIGEHTAAVLREFGLD